MGIVFTRGVGALQRGVSVGVNCPLLTQFQILWSGCRTYELHGDIFDACEQRADPFAELRTSALTGACAPDQYLLSAFVRYRHAHAIGLTTGQRLLSRRDVEQIFSDIREDCEFVQFQLSAADDGLSVLAQHTLYALAEEALRTGTDLQSFVDTLRGLIAHGHLAGMHEKQ